MYPHADLILPGLYLGNRLAAKEFPLKKGDLLISALTEDEYEDYVVMERPHIEWVKWIIDDDATEPIAGYFEPVHALIKAALKRGSTVLVHCAAGISRSPTLVAAYLMLERGWTAEAALDFLGKRRIGIMPNHGFREALEGAYRSLLGWSAEEDKAIKLASPI